MSLNVARKNSLELVPLADLSRETDQLIKKRLVGVSPWVRRTRRAVLIHSGHDQPILLEGEPGTGKEFIARLIHQCGSRRHAPFFALDCDSVSEDSFEASLFGVVNKISSRRFYTHKGLIEKAAGGTLYIQCAPVLAPVLKDKLGRLIVYRSYYRIGENVPEFADIRIIFGVLPHSDSAPSSVAPLPINERLSVPPLRRRKQDLEALINHFLLSYCQKNGIEPRELSPDTLHLLYQHDWPGNTGELKQVIESSLQKVKPPVIEPSMLPAYIANQSGFNGFSIPDGGIDLNEETERFEMKAVCAALKKCRGRQSDAASLLGLKRTTLHTKIKHYGIRVELFRCPE